MNLFTELNRRNVFRVAAAYVVLSWLLLQIGDVVFEALLLPGWSMKLLIALLALGFIPAMIFSWVYELTPEGIKKESEIGPQDSIISYTAKKLDVTVIVLLLAAISLFAVDRFLGGDQARLPTESVIPALGIGVMPFENLSANDSNRFFAGGVHEEVLTDLSRIANLRVISRTSMLQIAKAGLDVRAIGQRLGVSHLLEGSVRRVGDRVRVAVQLIDARTDRPIWSQHYDRTLTDIFAIQSGIALAIAGQLKIQLSPTSAARIAEVPTANSEAYDLYLRAVEERRIWRGAETFQAMKPLLEQAVALDPNFLRAQVMLASTYGRLLWAGSDPQRIYGVKALQLVTDIRRRWPNRIEGRLALGHYFYTVKLDYANALLEYQALLKVFPNDVETLINYSASLKRLGRNGAFLTAARRVAALDPESSLAASDLVIALRFNGLIDESLALARAGIERFPDDKSWSIQLAVLQLTLLGDVDAYLAEGARLRQAGSWQLLGSDLTWLLYDRSDLKSALAHITAGKQTPYGWGSVGPDLDLTAILRIEGRDPEAQLAADRAFQFVQSWIKAHRPFPDINRRYWYTFSALVAAMGGHGDALVAYRRRAAAAPAGEWMIQRSTISINASIDALTGDATAGWQRLAPHAGDPRYLTARYAATSPSLRFLYGKVPAFQAFVAKAGEKP